MRLPAFGGGLSNYSQHDLIVGGGRPEEVPVVHSVSAHRDNGAE